ncbi:MAG: class I SAM-dependent methyltransferase [Promethearchaeota archaeon]|nr:MAG: class I SAM-dependent methyltransferase [Candidatus Lokiarchaeota archaeon]
MKENDISLYKNNHIIKNDERLGLFERLNEEYSIRRALYPGSYAHITPIFVFPEVVFNDMYKKLESFYDSDGLFEYVNKRKLYSEEPYYSYINKDFNKILPLEENSFDLLISQYAGFVSRACRRYLKAGGILVVNNSHGDASMASISSEYKFIAVINKHNNNFTYSTRNLDKYFIPKKNIKITEKYLEKHNHGVGYRKSATDYVFKRLS